jgi:hypothetical protein
VCKLSAVQCLEDIQSHGRLLLLNKTGTTVILQVLFGHGMCLTTRSHPFGYRTSATSANGGNLLCVELCCCPSQLDLVILVYRVTCPENIEKEVFGKVVHALAMSKEAIARCCLSCLWMTLKASSKGCHEGRSPLKHDKFNITEFFTLKWPATEHSLLCSGMHRSEYAMPSRVSPML